jgi:type III secretory pathway component EscT
MSFGLLMCRAVGVLTILPLLTREERFQRAHRQMEEILG